MSWNLDQIGKYLLLFLTDGVAGYGLQFLSYSLAIYAFNKMKIKPLALFTMTLIFAVMTYGIRRLPISFGFHIILIMISCIMVSYLIFKTSIYPTVLAILLSAVSVLIFELAAYGVLNMILDVDKFDLYFKDTSTVDALIRKALMGIPTNILLVIEMIILYLMLPNKLKKGGFNGEVSDKDS